MTLVIAAPGKDFVILGADSRGVIDVGSGRAEINNCRKIIQITEYASILMYGASEAGNQLVEKYKAQIDPKLQDVTPIAEDFCRFCQNEERAIADVPKHPDSWVSFGFLVCGLKIKNKKTIPLIYNLRNFDGFRLGLCKPFAIKGKPLIAYYFFARDYREDMTLNEMCKLVAQSIYDTMQIDGDVGGPIRMLIIDSDGTRELPDSDVQNYLETWNLKNLKRIIQQ
jgi:20S proteasome alpha/beta subunit